MFFDQVEKLCRANGISPTDFVENELHMSRSNVTKWKVGKVPKSSTVQKVASYFDVSTDYLLGSEQKNKPSTEAESFSKNDIDFLAKIRKLNPSNRELAKVQIDALLALQEKQGK